MAKPRVFLSYSHRDEDWKDRLMRHLQVLQRQDLLTLWEDRKIEAGDTWRDEIRDAMEASTLTILLVSANFLGSPFVLDVEVPRLLQRRDQEGLRILPLLVTPCCWDCVPWLEPLNVFPTDAEPLSSKPRHEVDRDLAIFAARMLEQAKKPPREPAGRGPLPVFDAPARDAALLEALEQAIGEPGDHHALRTISEYLDDARPAPPTKRLPV